MLKPLVKRRLADRRTSLPIKPLLRPALVRRARAAEVPAVAGRHEAPARVRSPDVLAAVAAALRGPQLDGVLDGVAPAVPRPGAGRLGAAAPAVGASSTTGWSRAILRDGLRGVLTEKVRTRRWKVGFTTPETRWLRARRAAVQGLFRSPQFCARPYWDAAALADTFERFCAGEVEPSQIFWRAINTEIWLRVFFDARRRVARSAPRPASTSRASATSGWRRATNAPPRRWRSSPPHDQRHLFARSTVDGRDYARAPIRTQLFVSGDSLLDGSRATRSRDVELEPGDVVAVSEKAVAICQGRSYPVERGAAPGRWRARCRGSSGRTASGIGLGIPATMELAIREAGEARILARHRGGRGHQAVRREGRVLPGGRSRGARHRRPDPRHHPALRRPRQDGSRRIPTASRASSARAPGRRAWRSSTPTTSA